MIRKLLMGSAVAYGLMFLADTSTVEAGVKRLSSGAVRIQALQRARRPVYYTPYGYPYYLADPLYYGTGGYADGTLYRPQTPAPDPGINSSGYFTPQPGYQWNLFP